MKDFELQIGHEKKLERESHSRYKPCQNSIFREENLNITFFISSQTHHYDKFEMIN